MLTTVRLGPLALPTYPVLLILGFYLGLWLAARTAARRGLHPDHLYNAGFYAVLAGLMAGRLGHVLRFFAAYREDPLSVFTPNLIAFEPIVAAVAAGGVLALYVRRHRLPPAVFLDALSLGALLTLAVLALADGLNGRAWGMPTTLPWAIVQWDVHRHPVQYYELLGVLAVLSLLWTWLPRLPSGRVALAAVAGYAGVRLLVDAFRDRPVTIGDGFRLSQVIALVVLLLALILFYQTQSRPADDERPS
ncbi:MAG: prolipoprotein diacylglyceryl transferase [Anaerolineae bacterium]|nr:prolipoprotein diacylglyceryl transferase [Caldilineales bacterium]MDW8268385.1 prolipoprotein diacylglyceryl transferase [Anaerolineae bacterium]